MLHTKTLAKAFLAIIEEAEKIKKDDVTGKAQKRIQQIISIAKHQSDIRDAQKGKCCSAHKTCKK